MPDRPANQVTIRRPAQVPRLMYDSRRVLNRIDRLTAVPAAPNLIPHTVHAGVKFLLIIERAHHDMPPFSPLRVIAVMADDEALYAVVPGVNSRHSSRLTPVMGHHHLQTRS